MIHKISTKQNFSTSFFLHTFELFQDEIWSLVEATQVKHPDPVFGRDLMKGGKQLLFYLLYQETIMLACIQIFMIDLCQA